MASKALDVASDNYIEYEKLNLMLNWLCVTNNMHNSSLINIRYKQIRPQKVAREQ